LQVGQNVSEDSAHSPGHSKALHKSSSRAARELGELGTSMLKSLSDDNTKKTSDGDTSNGSVKNLNDSINNMNVDFDIHKHPVETFLSQEIDQQGAMLFNFTFFMRLFKNYFKYLAFKKFMNYQFDYYKLINLNFEIIDPSLYQE
jgi:hypothetical protein